MAYNQNPVGYVPVFDGGIPQTVTGYARAAISGGQFVYTSGPTSAVSSGLNSFAATDVLFVGVAASGALCVGIATHNAGSNTPLTVATKGFFLVRCDGSVVSSNAVAATGSETVVAAGAFDHMVGRLWTEGTSGTYVLLRLDM